MFALKLVITFKLTAKCNRLQKPITVSGYIFVTKFVLF